MMNHVRPLTLLSALLIASAVLVGQIKGLLLAEPPGSPPPGIEARPGLRPEMPAFLAYVPPPIARFQEAFARPVFSRKRQAPADSRDAEPTAPLRARLKGIVHIGNFAMALLATDGSEQPAQVGQGQRFQGWRLDQIHATQVVLSQKGKSITLVLPYPEHPARSP